MHAILLFNNNNRREISLEESLPGIASPMPTFWVDYICSKVQAAFPVCCPITDSDMAHMRVSAVAQGKSAT